MSSINNVSSTTTTNNNNNNVAPRSFGLMDKIQRFVKENVSCCQEKKRTIATLGSTGKTAAPVETAKKQKLDQDDVLKLGGRDDVLMLEDGDKGKTLRLEGRHVLMIEDAPKVGELAMVLWTFQPQEPVGERKGTSPVLIKEAEEAKKAEEAQAAKKAQGAPPSGGAAALRRSARKKQ